MKRGNQSTKSSKNSTGEKNFYLSILNTLNRTTNLSKIQEDLDISKQQLNYYLRRLKKEGLIIHKGRGWYEPVKSSKNSTKYDNHLKKDNIRGHAHIWEVKLPKKIRDSKEWKNRIKILEKSNIHFKLVGALKTTPRIKALGRKIWLCNDHLRIFDKKKESYYGIDAKESKKQSTWALYRIIQVLENKLGFYFKPLDFSYKREHYALIKNDLAIDQNQKGIIWRIKDENGDEWLLVDDSLEEGGELENIGKEAYKTNIPMQKWWNDNKKHNFKATPSFLMESIQQVTNNQMMFNKNFETHVEAIQRLSKSTKILSETVKELQKEIKTLKN